MHTTPEGRVAHAAQRAARLPSIADPLVIELLKLGFTWDGPGPGVMELFACYSRERIAANLAEAKRRRSGLTGVCAVPTPGYVIGACREDFARFDECLGVSAPAQSQAQSSPVAPAVALAVAPSAAPLSAFSFSLREKAISNTTTQPESRKAAGGGGSSAAMNQESWDLLAGMLSIAKRRQLATAYGPDVIRKAIELAKAVTSKRGGDTLGLATHFLLRPSPAEPCAAELELSAERTRLARAELERQRNAQREALAAKSRVVGDQVADANSARRVRIRATPAATLRAILRGGLAAGIIAAESWFDVENSNDTGVYRFAAVIAAEFVDSQIGKGAAHGPDIAVAG